MMSFIKFIPQIKTVDKKFFCDIKFFAALYLLIERRGEYYDEFRFVDLGRCDYALHLQISRSALNLCISHS